MIILGCAVILLFLIWVKLLLEGFAIVDEHVF